MNDINEQIGYSNRVRDVATRYFMPPEKVDGKPNPLAANPGFKAEAIAAIECMVSVARIFRVLETSDPSFIMSVVLDLSFGLSENYFWKTYGAVLTPVYKNSIHAFVTGRMLEIDMHKSDEKQSIEQRQKRQWLNMFIVSLDCLYGFGRASNISTTMIQELESII